MSANFGGDQRDGSAEGTAGGLRVSSARGHGALLVDVNGWFGDGTEGPPAGTFTGITPIRICDSRPDQPGVVTNQCNSNGNGAALGSGRTMTVNTIGSGLPVPSGATGVVANVTVTGTTASSFLTVWPAGATQPNASDLNWSAGQTVPNLVVVQLSSTGQISMFNHAGSTNVIVDVVGYYL